MQETIESDFRVDIDSQEEKKIVDIKRDHIAHPCRHIRAAEVRKLCRKGSHVIYFHNSIEFFAHNLIAANSVYISFLVFRTSVFCARSSTFLMREFCSPTIQRDQQQRG